MNNPREFWILDESEVYKVEQDTGHLRCDQVHVIEYSAYEKLSDYIDGWRKSFYRQQNKSKALADELETERASNKGIREALENWVKWEDEQISNDGPYVGKAITELITNAKKALAER